MDRAVRCSGNNIFFGQRLQAICHGLQDAVISHPIRAVAVLYSAQPFTLQNRGQRKQNRKDEKDGKDGQQNRNGRLDCGWRVAQEPVLERDKNLVQHYFVTAVCCFLVSACAFSSARLASTSAASVGWIAM